MGRIERMEVYMDTFKRKRTLRIYLPTCYDDGNESYDVLYMHDGHNLFDQETSFAGIVWGVHTTLDQIETDYHKNVIVVGIDGDSEHRIDEYAPWEMEDKSIVASFSNREKVGGEGAAYVHWIVNSLIPFINRRYRTTKRNYMAGSSMGGLISLYAGFTYPEQFIKVGAMSPSIWFNKPALFKYIQGRFSNHLGVYLDIGGKEVSKDKEQGLGSMPVKDCIELRNLLKNLGLKNLKYVYDEDAKHHEKAWANRFPIFMKWLLDIEIS